MLACGYRFFHAANGCITPPIRDLGFFFFFFSCCGLVVVVVLMVVVAVVVVVWDILFYCSDYIILLC